MKVHNWSKYPEIESDMRSFTAPDKLPFDKHFIPRGNGRCYGDASLHSQIISTLNHNKALFFDTENGVFTCQSGMTLDRALEIIVPKGWFLPVTPGTKFITVGGAVASDVHGKNHHFEGSFSNHIFSFDLLDNNNQIITCSKNSHPELFETTCGGMGLTGIILNVTFQLKKIESAYIKQQSIKAKNLEELIELFEENQHVTYSVSWIDCLQKGKNKGRGLLNLGEHAKANELTKKAQKDPFVIHPPTKFSMPMDLPSFSINKLTVKAFNTLYYNKQRSKVKEFVSHYDPFFYPLDAILEWNRVYGKKGFLQYQFVLPLETSSRGLHLILDKIRAYGQASPLVVLKLFGKQDDFISFPMEGYTLALDFPIRKGLFEFLTLIDNIILDLGGRLYLTKDARMAPETFDKGYANAKAFKERIKEYNPDNKFASDQSERLNLTSK